MRIQPIKTTTPVSFGLFKKTDTTIPTDTKGPIKPILKNNRAGKLGFKPNWK